MMAPACGGLESSSPGAPSAMPTSADATRTSIVVAASIDTDSRGVGRHKGDARGAGCVDRVGRRIRTAVEEGHITGDQARRLREAFRLFCRAVGSGERSRAEAYRTYLEPVLDEVFPQRRDDGRRRRLPRGSQRRR